MQTTPRAAVRNFFKTTTLHGFKYLSAPNFLDRLGWVLSCCASACCAGMLCTVLWARYLQVPALLSVQSDQPDSQSMPTIAFCLPAEQIAFSLVDNIGTNKYKNDTKAITEALTGLLLRKVNELSNLLKLQEYLSHQNESLAELILRYMPDCNEFILKCRWLTKFIPCNQLFKKRITQWGSCCVLPSTLHLKIANSIFLPSNQLTLALRCPIKTDENIPSGCQYYTKFREESSIQSKFLMAGNNYISQFVFNAVINEQDESLTNSACNSRKEYTQSKCTIGCIQKKCGCLDPLLPSLLNAYYYLPQCTLSMTNCLRSKNYDRSKCVCLPGCKQISSLMSLETSPIFDTFLSFDPMYKDLNVSSSLIIKIQMVYKQSKLFKIMPTETWLSLLSSLGGVFNMFLGVGLFTALEILFLLIIRLPFAFKKSTEMRISTQQLQNDSEKHYSLKRI